MTLLTVFIFILAAISWVDIGLGVAVALLGVLAGAGVLGAKFAAIVKQVSQALDKLREVRASDGPGGSSLTDQERQELTIEALDILEEIWKQYSGGILEKIGNLFNKE